MGKAYWRSLDELADTPGFRRFVESEFPGLAGEMAAPASRRSFLKIMGASLAMAGMASCRWPREAILPFANRPEGRIPGVPSSFATAMDLGGGALGLVVKSYDGRPVKVEGNPDHPETLGAASVFAQAAVLELYDPARSRSPVQRSAGQALKPGWDAFSAFVAEHFSELKASGGEGLAVLAGTSSSLSVAFGRRRLLEVFPAARWYEYEPLSRDAERAGSELAFGSPHRSHLHPGRAAVIVTLDADILSGHPAALRVARELAAGRRGADGVMNRLYAAEGLLSLTGAVADHRLALPPGRIGGTALRLAVALRDRGVEVAGLRGVTATPPEGAEARFVAAAAADLAKAGGRGVVVAGPGQPAEVHVLALAINAALGSVGTTVTLSREEDASRPPHMEAIGSLAGELGAGRVQTLLILGGNPVYDAPADVGFAAALAGCPTAVHLSLYDDETSRKCQWHVPQAHFLESWGDARAWDGTVSVVQPLIEPLYGGRTAAELLALAAEGTPAAAYGLARRALADLTGSTGFETAWKRALSEGVVEGTAYPKVTPVPRAEAVGAAAAALRDAVGAQGPGLELVFVGDSAVHDGRFANNAWLQELPDPVTKLTWDNAALLSPATARAAGVRHGDLVRVEAGGRSLEMAVYVVPGQADGTVGAALGYGRTAGGPVADGAGFDTYRLRTTAGPYHAPGASLTPTGARYLLATTQDHHAIDTVGLEERGHRIGALVREGTLAEFLADPRFAAAEEEERKARREPLWTPIEFTGEHQWGMAIDLAACVGCNACMVACQAENNVAVVGKRQVANGREMHWIRVDRYFSGDEEAPRLVFQPVTCQQCENAPCESVCPVAATVHSEEGLNQMVYNRCVGTRYCSNNCPYKVRRFNFFNYVRNVPEVTRMHFNPEVTVRSRGVMEKCSFCIQRIELAKIRARNDQRPLRDGEIVPACAQTCPTRAIVFGDLRDASSRVSAQHRDPRAYGLLAEVFTKPRNVYLARLRNPSGGTEEGR